MSKPLPQRIVPFYSDELIAVQRSDGVIFVLFTRLCDNLKLPRWTQSRRVQHHAVLSAGLVTLTIETPGGPQEAQCLRIDLLPLWLAGVSARKADAAVKEKLILYQTEAAQVLWREFKPQIINEPDHDLAPSTDNELAQLAHIAELGRAITRMAEEQLEMRRRVDAAARAFKTIRHDLSDVQVRLGVLEDRLHPATYITDAQATEVSNVVKALAELLTNKETGKNHYQGIFGELYRRFGVSSYKVIRVEQYASVLAFLEDWRRAAQEGATSAPA